jgi:hypothetical protein
MSKHIELAKKLKALAEKGIGGEKTTAEKMLNDLLKKHNLTIEEVEGEKLQDFYFSINDKHIWTLLYQIIKYVNLEIRCFGEIPKDKIRELKLKGNYLVECTVSEYIEIEAKFDFYSKLYKSELDTFLSAFIEANDLGINDPNRVSEELTHEEYLELLRIEGMASKIKKGEFRKQLK